jgi:TonB family protein
MSQPTLSPGSVFASEFRIERPLAEGGMGAVYIAEQLGTGQRRALKVMQPQLLPDEKSRQRFLEEARIGSRIESEHVVQVVAAGVDPASGTPWLAMELLDGADLDRYVRGRGALPVAEALELLEQAAHALADAHAKGIVHRDLKPENLFVAKSRRRGAEHTVKILDFGIARTIAESRAGATVTTAIGSPLWMAPEQAQTGAKLRPATDVWALGLIAFFVFSGRSYWRSANHAEFNLQALLVEVMTQPIDPASARAAELGANVPHGFDAWFARCVVREPEARWPDAGVAIRELRNALMGFAATAPVSAPGAAVPYSSSTGPSAWTASSGAPHAAAWAQPSAPPASSSSGWLIGLGAVALLGLLAVGGLGLAWVFVSGDEERAPVVSAGVADPPRIEPAPMEPLRPSEPEVAPPPTVTESAVRPHLGAGDPEVRGSLSREAIQLVIQSHLGEVQSCYERELVRDPALRGRVLVSFVIGPSGAVQSAAVTESTLRSPRVEGCIVEAVRRWTFPPPEGGGVVGVNYPFVLTSGEGGDAPAAPPEELLSSAERTDRARECIARGDNRCAIEALEGHAENEQQLAMLIEAHRARGNREQAHAHMRTYVDRFPGSTRARMYSQIARSERRLRRPMAAEEQGLELEPDGLRFTSAEAEAAYIEWQTARTIAFNRVANSSSLAALLFGLACLLVFGDQQIWPIVGISAVLVPASLVLRQLYSRPRRASTIHFAVACVNALFGIALVVIDVFLLGALELSVGVVVAVAFFAFTLNRTRPLYAIAGAATYVALDVALLAHAMATGALAPLRGGLEIGLLLVVFAVGVRAARTIDADGRRTYRQELIIERQKARIERAEALLKQELSHQVAARSRELGRMLASATIVPGRPKVGERFDARYRVEKELGAGAMGAVFEVVRTTDDRRLALKVVTGEVSPDRAARFAREAEIGAKVRHPNLVEIVDVGVADGGVPYLAMELAPAGSLEAKRDRFGDAAWAREILRGIAEGLCALHEAGVVHRDLKPANVLLGQGGAPKISDFGISRFGELGDDVDANASTLAAAKPQALTATGMLLGTPYYMAPEAARGAKVEAAADVFAFGILAVEMLTGRPPFATAPMFRALAGERLEPPALDGLDAALRDVLCASLAEDAAVRPNMRAVRSALA